MITEVDNGPGTLRLIFWEEEQDFRLHRDLLRPETIDTVCILLGPEGGLAPAEIAAARESGWQTVSLGRRILRAETATLTAVSLVQYLPAISEGGGAGGWGRWACRRMHGMATERRTGISW